MSILWCGGEDIDFPNGSACAPPITTGGRFRSGYSRFALNLQSYTGECYSNPFPGGAITSFWLSFQWYFGYATTNIHPRSIGLVNTAYPTRGLFFGSVNGTPDVRVTKYDGTTLTTVASSSDNSLFAGINKIDVCVTSYGATANLKVYVNGSATPSIDVSGVDLSVSGIADLNAVRILGLGNVFISISEIIVANEDTRTFSLVTHYPNEASGTLDWSGAYTTIDENAIADADLTNVNTNDKDAQYGISATPAGSFAVHAIKIAARATKTSDSTPTKLQLGLYDGATIDVDAGQTPTTGWATYERLTAQINSAQITTAIMDSALLVLRSAA